MNKKDSKSREKLASISPEAREKMNAVINDLVKKRIAENKASDEKKGADKKTTTKKAQVKKSAEKKPERKKTTVKKTENKKSTDKKTVVKKTESKNNAAKKTVANKKAANKKTDSKKSEIKNDNKNIISKSPVDSVVSTDIVKDYYFNRELSWLDFNERVLNEATYPKNPLGEKLTFLSIYQSNLDEFFSVRVGSLHDQNLVEKDVRENKTNMTAAEQIECIMKKTAELIEKKNAIYANLLEKLKEEGIEIVNMRDLGEEDLTFTQYYFDHSVMPLLSPQVIAKKNPFPFLRDKEIYAVVVLDAKKGQKIGLVPCNLDRTNRLVSLPSDPHKYVLMEEIILHFIPQIFDQYGIKSKSLIRIIRNADIDADERFNDDDEDDFRDLMERLIKVRRKLCPIKMEYQRILDDEVIEQICKEINLERGQTFLSQTPLDFSFFSEIKDMLRDKKELFFPRKVPGIPDEYGNANNMMELVEKKDRLLFYPYNSMKPFLNLLKEAANSPKVDSIKITLYRVARNSQIVETLIEAAENGKEVVVLVELRARFDEENNIGWSRRLEEAGCRIIYGLDQYKVHSKLCLITYRDDDGIKYITQVGTGNYNETTARLYTDYCLMTANEEIGFEASGVFRNLCMEQVVENTKQLLVAPKCLQNRILEMIDEQIAVSENGGQGFIGIKINSLTDKKIIDKLVEASCKGVKIEMVIRGICCLKAGIKGVTQNIHVYSIVGRYLEHSRIYIFGRGADMKMYIASADFMTRNTTRRVEVAVPILDNSIKRRIYTHFNTMLKDNINLRRLLPDGTYALINKKENSKVVNSQSF